ncbi:MAG: peptidoglycan-binding protein [Methylococcales bacterium]|nr:peptidoglycan-binding protein [Methylococcales bacterium]
MSFLRTATAVISVFFGMTVLAGEEPFEPEPAPPSEPVATPDIVPPPTVEAPIKVRTRIKPPLPIAFKKPAVVEKPAELAPPDYYRTETKIYPRNRIEDIEDILKQIPANAIAPFLTSPNVVEKEAFKKSPYIIDFPDRRLVAGAGTRVYVRAILQPKTLNYSVYRKGKPYYNPETKEFLGHEALYLASATLQREGDPATLLLTKSKREVKVGDRLMEAPTQMGVQSYFPQLPTIQINANLISVLDGVSQIGRYNVVVIDKGNADGLKVGDVLDIYQKGRRIVDKISEDKDKKKLKLPDELAGTLMVFRTFNRVSYGLIMKASKAIHVFDKVKTPEYARF